MARLSTPSTLRSSRKLRHRALHLPAQWDRPTALRWLQNRHKDNRRPMPAVLLVLWSWIVASPYVVGDGILTKAVFCSIKGFPIDRARGCE